MQLTYFAARGSCDQIRLLLAEAGLLYKEINVSGAEFSKIKHTVLFGQLPILGINSEQFQLLTTKKTDRTR
jgi:glutathione S-transferase